MSLMVCYHDMSPFSVIHGSSTFSEIRSSGIISVGEITDKLQITIESLDMLDMETEEKKHPI